MTKQKKLEKIFSKKLSDFILDSNKKIVVSADKNIKSYTDFLASLIYALTDDYFSQEDINKIFKESTTLNESVVELFIPKTKYPKNKVVFYKNNLWQSKISNNSSTPIVSNSWTKLLPVNQVIIDGTSSLYALRTTTITATGDGIIGGGNLDDNRTIYLDFTFLDNRYIVPSGDSLQYYRGDKTWQTLNTTVVPEGTNLYYTNVRVDDRINIQKGVALGLAPLDSGAKIDELYLPDSILGQVSYQGTYNATTDTPALGTASITNKGNYYVVSVAGGVYSVGDWAISNGTSWEKVDNTDAVTTVFGRLGAILALESDYSGFYPVLSGSYSNPSWISSLAWSKISGTPTTLAGYGITDGQSVLSGTGIVKSTTGTISYLTDNSANWNTAYGWGNHATYGYITAASVGNGTLTMNVSGSGLSGSASFTANQSGASTFTITSNATTAATANTLVYRDASGHITGNYGFFGYINTSNNIETSATYFIVKNGDDYHRSLTPTNAAVLIRNNASGSWGINVTGTAASETLSTVTGRGASTSTYSYFNGGISFYYIGAASVPGSSYGTIRADGVTGGYGGLYLNSCAGTVVGMYDTAGNGGDFDPTTGWHFYWLRANACLAIGGSTTQPGYRAAVNGSLHVAGSLLATSSISASNFSGSSSGTNTGDQTNISGNAATATLASTVSISTDRIDSAWYQVMWATSGGVNLYSTANVTIRSSAYGGVGFNGSSWYIEGNATYGLYSNTGFYAAGGLWDAGNRVYSAGNPQVNISGNASTVTINYNNDSNSTYQMLWGSSNSVFGTAGIYCNPSTDALYASTFRASAGVYGSWLYAEGASGLYFNTYGYGIWAPGGAGAPYGNVTTYGAGVGGWDGYGIGTTMRWMGRPGVGDNGLHTDAMGWGWYIIGAQISIGGASPYSSYKVTINGSCYFDTAVYMGSSITAAGGGFNSDLTLKDIITRDLSSSYIADKVSTFIYKWNDHILNDTKDKTTRRFGYGAQEIQSLIPEAVYEINDGTLAIDYTQVHTVLIDENTKRIQELEKEVRRLGGNI